MLKKQKAKTRISAFVKREMGEWIRKTAYDLRCSQGELIRQALKELRKRLDEN